MNANVDTIEDFAALLAELASPFAVRRATLSQRGLSDDQFAELNARWTTEMRAAGGGDSGLAARFQAAYKTMSAALRAAEYRVERLRPAGDAAPVDVSRAAPEHSPRFLNVDAQPFRAEAAEVALLAPTGASIPVTEPDTERLVEPASSQDELDSTVELSGAPAVMMLPFTPAPVGQAATAAKSPPLPREPEAVEDNDTDATLPLGGTTGQRVLQTRRMPAQRTAEALPLVKKPALPFTTEDGGKKPQKP